MSHPSHFPRPWREAERRAKTYLRALRGTVAADERRLLAIALTFARAQARLHDGTHPVTLVMEALFSFLPVAQPAVMAPPIERSRMLPEPTEFPVHDWLRRSFRRN